MVSISSLPFNCSQLEHVAFWQGRAGVSHTHTQRTFCGQHEGAAGVLMQFRSNSFQSRESRGLSLSMGSAQTVNLHLCVNLMWHTKGVLTSGVGVLYVRMWRWMREFKNQLPSSESNNCDCLKGVTFCPPDPTMRYLLQQLPKQCPFN